MKYLKVFTDFVGNMRQLGDAERGRLFTAMLEYASTGIEPDLRGNERFLWDTAKKNIDNQRDSYDTRCAVNAKNGSIGGKRTQANASELKRNQAKSSDSLQDKEKEKEESKEINSKEFTKKAATASFTPPTLEEVKAYAKTAGLNVDCDYFYKYFTTPNANGETWIDSQGNKVRNWKQKLLTWSRHSNGTATVRRDKYSAEKYEQHTITEDMLRDAFVNFEEDT